MGPESEQAEQHPPVIRPSPNKEDARKFTLIQDSLKCAFVPGDIGDAEVTIDRFAHKEELPLSFVGVATQWIWHCRWLTKGLQPRRPSLCVVGTEIVTPIGKAAKLAGAS